MSTDKQQDAREQARHKASVMIAFAEGEEIQYRKIGNQEWTNDHNPWFRWDIHDYLVKPEERKPSIAYLWLHPNKPGVYRTERYFGDHSDAEKAGWVLTTFAEVLPSENTGENKPS